ncbi:hypothetical protein P261_01386 [Lachnospiraceae bacterium TWA4]|nr:hypothetical protein P261_01386 [Lachnospiraceae bacterium TWA4]
MEEKTVLLNLENYESDMDAILSTMDESAKDFYEDILDELVDDVKGQEKPFSTYIKVTVNHLEDGNLEIGGLVFDDEFLKKRLEGIDTVYLFASTIGLEMYNYYVGMTDAVEKVVFTYMMQQALNEAFDKGAKAIIKEFPANARMIMETPGIKNQWDLKDQHKVTQILENHYDGEQLFPVIDDKAFFDRILYSYCGMLYVKGEVSEGSAIPTPAEVNDGKISAPELLEYLNSTSGHV